ncbi:MAG: methyltransferase, partial [Pseudomonadota bacterium]
AATDPVLLAAACPARPRQRVLDVGCGVGAAAFCLAARAPGVDLEGVEIQEAYADLSRRNAQRLGVGWLAHVADVRAAPLALRATSYDHVLTNPPYHAAGAALALDDPAKDAANRETADLETWLDFCLRRLKPKGSLTVIHRAERLDDILAALRGRAGGAAILPLWPRPGLPAKRVIVRAVKEGRGPLRLCRGLTLHGADGGAFSPEAEAVLRQGAPLDM